MHLLRGLLNSRSRDVMRDLADPVQLHRTVLSLMPDDLGPTPRRAAGVLFRVDVASGGAILIVQSAVAPNVTRLPVDYFVGVDDDRLFDLRWTANPTVESIATSIARETRLRFRLRANVTRRVDTKSGPDGARRHGRRVPLTTDEARAGWLARKAEAAGFRVLDVRIAREGVEHGNRNGKRATWEGTRFDGLLQVVEPDAFEAAVRNGVGPGKAYGFGLLSFRAVGS